MARKPPERPRWYFSLRSPYAWFAFRDLLEHHREVADAIDWLPCWEPDPPTAGLLAGIELPWVPMSRAKSFYVLKDTRRLARERGLSMSWPVDREPHWDVPHLGFLAAEEAGRGREFVSLAYQERWEKGRDICDRAVIASIAGRLGLDPGGVADACDDPWFQRAGAERLTRSYHDGVFGVPFFIRGREPFFGVDRLPAYARAHRGGGPLPAPGAAARSGGPLAGLLPAGLDSGPGGGCG
ncbi:2-hydroxychromene-2-carboxylate isomerase [Streptomyces jumonjinensis]|uniref:2-hydroxychromene-2-carboxylate isomerase n=1 Tax=Streptomyces jumonjinensis TaxID=1945 RepID=UPI0037B1D6D7